MIFLGQDDLSPTINHLHQFQANKTNQVENLLGEHTLSPHHATSHSPTPSHTTHASSSQFYSTPPLHGIQPIQPTRPPPSSPQMQTRSRHDIFKPNPKYGCLLTSPPPNKSPLPKSHKIALTDPN